MKFDQTTYYKQVPDLKKIGNHIIKLVEKHGNPIAPDSAIWQEFKVFSGGGHAVCVTVFNHSTTYTITIYDFESKESAIKKLQVIDNLFKGEIKTIEELEKFGF